MSDRDLLEPRGMTSEELKSLVDEYTARGGKIKQCEEGVALNFRLDVLSGHDVDNLKTKVKVIKKAKAKTKKK